MTTTKKKKIGIYFASLAILALFIGPTMMVTTSASSTPRVTKNILLVEDGSCNTAGSTALSDLGIPYTKVDETGFKSANLNSYNVLYVSSAILDNTPCQNLLAALASRAADIVAWLKAGDRGVVAEAETYLSGGPPPNPFSWLPGKISVYTQASGGYGDTVTIVKANGATKGLTSADLSNWSYSFHCQIASANKYTTLATGTSSAGIGTYPVIMQRTVGSKGGIIVVTCLDPAVHYTEGIGGASYAAILLQDMWNFSAK